MYKKQKNISFMFAFTQPLRHEQDVMEAKFKRCAIGLYSEFSFF